MQIRLLLGKNINQTHFDLTFLVVCTQLKILLMIVIVKHVLLSTGLDRTTGVKRNICISSQERHF